MLTLFGDQWVASIPVLRWMTAFGAATATTLFASTALIAANHAAREVRMTVKVHVLRIGIVASTAPLGIVPLAMGLSAASIVEIVIVVLEIRRTLGIGVRTLARIYAQAAFLTAWSALPAFVVMLAQRMDALRLPGCWRLSPRVGGRAVGIIACSAPAGTGSGESGGAFGGTAPVAPDATTEVAFGKARPTAFAPPGRSRVRTAPRADGEICARRSLRRGH
jgi:hypothetical protein